MRTLPALYTGGITVLIALLWLWLFRPLFPYLGIIGTREDFRTNQILLIGVALLIVLRLRQDGARLASLQLAPALRPAPVLLFVLATLAYVFERRFFDVNTLGAVLFGISGYGLLGCWLSPGAWRAGAPAAALLIAILPFGDFLQVFVGYPMRIVTAEIVRMGFQSAGIGTLGIDTILVFENGVSNIDLPCSGVKSLWTGALFYLAATWLERKPTNARWFAGALVFGAVLFITNLLRVAVLIAVGEVLGWRLFAEMLLAPLGIVSFALACSIAFWLLRQIRSSVDHANLQASVPVPRRHAATGPLLIAALLAANIAYAPPTVVAAATAPAAPAYSFPAELQVAPVTLRAGELDWLYKDGATSVERVRFSFEGISGSLILVESTTWRAHHNPERCFENYGLRKESENVVLIDPDHSARVLRLARGASGATHGAMYWFQSKDTRTDDYGTRLWSAFSLSAPNYVLVSVLFDASLPPDHPALYRLARVLRQSVDTRLMAHPQTSP